MKVFILILLTVSVRSWAIVDMKSANYSESWVDMKVPGVGYDLRVNRTYNSRSLFNGIFGFGWCSDYETKIVVTPESTIKLTECGAGMEITYTANSYKSSSIDSNIDQIIAAIKKRRPDLSASYIATLKTEMKTNEFMRDEFSRRLNIRGRVAKGQVYRANGREAENITLKNGIYKRSLPDGTYELFDAKSGHMTAMYDKNGNYLKLFWKQGVLLSVADNLGRKLTFTYDQLSKKVSEIYGPNGLMAHYTVKGDDLISVIDAKKQHYFYQYDDVHNLTKITYPDKTYKALTYNKDKDWVTSFRNRKGCLETYSYHVSPDDPKNHFWSDVLKKCGTKITNRSQYEFFHRPRPDGNGVYLYRVKMVNNDDVTDIIYHQVFGKPIEIMHNNERTDYTYYDNGFVRTKKTPAELETFQYKDKCSKVSLVTTQFFRQFAVPVAKSRTSRSRRPSGVITKVVRTVNTKFFYDQRKCNLILADNSDGQKVALQYDSEGRISQIEDQARKLVNIKYEPRFGKPWIVSRPGLGTIKVVYTSDGQIAKVESKQGPRVAIQVASIFNNLLDIIAPATSEAPL